MKVVHLSLTPLAGAPIRLVRAINRYTAATARLVNLNPDAYGRRTFDEDIDFCRDKEEALQAISDADLIHCHHWIDVRRNPFGVDLTGRNVIRQYHSEPAFIAAHAGITPAQVINAPEPQLVVAQFHERLYPNAQPVPNLLDYDAIDRIEHAVLTGSPTSTPRPPPCVAFFPTASTPAAQERWSTKGAPETARILHALARQYGFTVDIASDLPHSVALNRRRAAAVVIDEMVTGSYHLSGLEGLALGRPTFGYLDARMIAVLSLMTGSDSLPWINIPLHLLEHPLMTFIESAELRTEVGNYARMWMRRYWDTAVLVKRYMAAYEDVCNGRTRLRERPAFEVIDRVMQDFSWNNHLQSLARRQEPD